MNTGSMLIAEEHAKSGEVWCAGISRVGLKSLVESVRLQTLSRAGLQQLQLDVHYLRPLLRRSANPLTPSSGSQLPVCRPCSGRVVLF